MPDGTRLKLRAIRCGSKFKTTDEWLTEFLDAQTAAFGLGTGTQPGTPSDSGRSGARRETGRAAAGNGIDKQAAERASDALVRMGC